MSYVKKTWANGDTITAAGLNNIENGVKANDTACAKNAVLFVPFAVTVESDTPVASTTATFADVAAAIAAGRDVVALVAMPGGTASLYAPVVLVDDPTNPGSISFGTVADLSGYGETYTPVYYQCTIASGSENVDLRLEPLTLASN